MSPVLVAGTDPYPWPYDGGLDPTRLALVLAGWDSHWAARVTDHGAARANALVLADAVIAAGGTVIGLAHPRPPRAPADAPEPAALPVPGGRPPLWVAGIDGFTGGSLELLLRAEGLDQLLLAGNGLEASVHSTLRSANDRGDECLLVVDACGPLTAPEEAAVGAVACVTMSGGIFGAIGTLAAVLDALSAVSPASTPSLEEVAQ